MKTPITPDVAILKGIGKINGDGWKDVTREGEVVFVWNRELPAPYSPGQFPRVGLENWSASTDQYDFSPADADDVDAIRAALSTPTAPEAAPAITVENDCTFAEMVEQAQEDGKLVKAGLTSTPPARVAIERARSALERLANTRMDLSLTEWGEISGDILSALSSTTWQGIEGDGQ